MTDEYTPDLEDVVNILLNHLCMVMPEDEAKASVRRFFDSHDASVSQEVWKDLWIDVIGIPHWWNPEQKVGGYDLGGDGMQPATEEGAFMEVRRALLGSPHKGDLAGGTYA